MSLQPESTIIDVTPTSASDMNTGNGPSLANLLDEMAKLITHYVHLPHPLLGILIACWITLTYCFKQFQYCGYLAIQSATPQCGKSRLMTLIRWLVKGTPPITAIPTAANLYRTLHDVILLDEVDKLRNCDRDQFGDVLAVLNVGFEKDGTIQRLVKDAFGNFVQRDFPVYGPKVLVGIESLADALADRSFSIHMVRSATRSPRLRVKKHAGRFNYLRTSLEAWVTKNEQSIEQYYEQLPDEVPSLAKFDDRFQDIAEPLLVLAYLADAERHAQKENIPNAETISERLISALIETVQQRKPSEKEEAFLAFLAVAKDLLKDRDCLFMASSDLVAECVTKEELEWITKKKLANFLQPFGLSPRRNSSSTIRGYQLTAAWVNDWLMRY